MDTFSYKKLETKYPWTFNHRELNKELCYVHKMGLYVVVKKTF